MNPGYRKVSTRGGIGKSIQRRQLKRKNVGTVSSFKQKGGIVQRRTGQSNRKGHPLRIIKKPRKYITSSEPETGKKITTSNKENEKDIDEDINDLRRNLSDENANPNHLNASQVFRLMPLESVVTNDTGPVTPENTTEKTYTPLLPLTRLTESVKNLSDPYISGNSNINVSKSNCYRSFNNFARPRYDNTMLYGNEQCQYAAPSAPYTTMSCSAATIGDFKDQYTGLREVPENTRQSILGDVPQYGRNPTHTTREDEMRVLREKIDNVITREEYNKTLLDLSEKVATKDDLQLINRKLDKLLRKRINVMPAKPTSFPLSSVEEVVAFENVTDEKYEAAVSIIDIHKKWKVYGKRKLIDMLLNSHSYNAN